MKKADPRVERLGDALGIVASIWFAFTAWWGEFQIPSGGHIGAGAAATTMMAEEGLRWHTFYPLFDWYATKSSYPAGAYCHHPYGQYWASALALIFFGHRNFVPDLPAAIMSTLTVPLLYKTGKRVWGPLPGAAAALGFAMLPITAGFSMFHNLEVMVIFGVTLFFYGHTKYQQTGHASDLVLSLAGATIACAGDWVGYLIMGPLLGWAFLRAWVLPEWATPHVDVRRYSRWWAWSVCIAVVTLALWVAMFKHVDKLDDWLSSAESRGGGDAPLAKVLESRRTWIDFSFTPFAIAVGKVALPVAALRLAWRRRDEEAFSLAALFGAVVQYVTFKRGADVHTFWPHYFGLYYAYALAQLVASAESVAAFVARFVAPTRARAASIVAAAAFTVVPIVLVTPDTVRALKIWRATGGKYNDNGTLLRSHQDMLVVVQRLLAPKVRRGEAVGYHPGANWGWEHQWALAGLSVQRENPNDNEPFWVARASGLGGDHLLSLASSRHLRIFGDTVLVTRGDRAGAADAYSLNEHEPNLLQWMFVNNVEPVRRIGTAPDEFLTWEWRYHLGQAATPPARAAVTLDEVRIAHNAAVARGDGAEAERLLDRIRSQLVRDPETHYEGGHELMGVRVRGGVKPTLEIWFEAGGPTANDTTFAVRSSIVKKNPLSWIPVDKVDREMAWPPPLSSKLWKKGFVYVFEAVLNHRIGLERYSGHWRAGPPPVKHGNESVDLLYLP